jgi:hypothetical protein
MVPAKHKEEGYAVGGWVTKQRSNKEALPSERRQRLEDLGFVWDARNDAWEEGFSKLQQFKKREGHCKVPAKHKEAGYGLGGWVNAQRSKKEVMPAERRQRLDDLGFVWDTLAEAWEEGFSNLQQFKDREGHCMVPAKYNKEGYGLGIWVSTQRSNSETLSAERRQRLDDLGFVWDPLTEAWEAGFSKLQQFKDREGHCLVPKNHKEDELRS